MASTAFPDVSVFPHNTARPLIGLPPRWLLREGASSNEPLIETANIDHLLTKALLKAGALPVMLPMTHDEQELKSYLELCDGFVFSGGPDVDPVLFGGDPTYDKSLLCPERDAMELPLLRMVLEANKPVVTICRGTQLLNVALGGTLSMDIYSHELPEGTPLWNHVGALAYPVHPVHIKEGSLLHTIVGKTEIPTNSAHHCYLNKLAPELELIAWTSDGIPEAVVLPNKTFALGVQWHPEQTWQRIPSDFALWEAFVSVCASQG